MERYLSDMEAAIQSRRSHRHYIRDALTAEHSNQMQAFLSNLSAFPFNHIVKISLHIANEEQDIVYFKGPRNFASLSTDGSYASQAKLGFLGELLLLYAESIGIKTCWMGHYKKNIVNDIVFKNGVLNENEKLYCIITLGYVPEKTGLMDRISEKRLSKKPRKVEDFLHSDSLQSFPSMIHDALEKACRAPSAMNSQKWKYLVSATPTGYSVEIAKPPGYRHFKWAYYDIDVGTAAAHFWISLKNKGIESNPEVIQEDDRSVWRFHI